MNAARLLALVLACSLPALASAQWLWVDKDGRKVFSDQAPPSDIPAKNILKQPAGGAAAPAPASTATPVAAAASRPASGLRPTGKDSALEDKKKQAEAAEEAAKKAEEEKYAKAKAENCQRARQAKATYDSGQRIGRINAKGEREVLDDAQRTAEIKRIDGIIASECK
jgi:hypothetical protein